VSREHDARLARLLDELKNWGRWGPDDELGTLNFISPDVRRAALASVRHGVSVGCARPILTDAASDVPRPPLHYMYATGETPGAPGAADFIGVTPHGSTVTHVDSLSHIFWDGRMYNDRPADLVNAALGSTIASVEAMKDGIVTRGVLLDVAHLRDKPFLDPGESIGARDLDAAERAVGVQVRSGDALLVRTGAYRRRIENGPGAPGGPYPGLDASTLPWLKEREIAVLASDAVNDATPADGGRGPLHVVGIVGLGLCLLDGCQFEDLAAACREHDQFDFLFTVAPLRFRYATGSPVTPIALL